MIEFAGDSDMLTIGKLLRNERERQDLSVDDIADKTKIHPKYIKAIEEDRRDGFPGDLYCELFTKSYAEALGLEYARIKAGTFTPASPPAEQERRPRRLDPSVDNRRKQQARPESETPKVGAGPDTQPDKARVYSSADRTDERAEVEELAEPDATGQKNSMKRLFMIGGGIVLCLFVILLYVLYASRTPSNPDHAPEGEGGDSSETSSTVDPLSSGAVQDSAFLGEQTPVDSMSHQPVALASDSLDVIIVSADQSWARVVADGDTVFSSLLRPGVENQFKASDRMVVSLGRWDNVSVTVFGYPLKPLRDFYQEGRSSVRLEITRDNWLSLIDSGRIGSE
jgi:cytoskeletal protein RodZ